MTTYIERAKNKANSLITSPLAGNSINSPSVDNAIYMVRSMKFYETQVKEIRFWKRVLKELEIKKTNL